MINKKVKDVSEVIDGVKSNMTLMFGGFGCQEYLKLY